jgi:hypothetical protein
VTLRISTQIYKGQARLVPPLGNEGDGFESAVNTALDRIRSTEAGAGLLREIEGDGQEVLIVKAGQNVDNNCVQSSQTEPACNAACYQEVLNAEKLGKKIEELFRSNKIQKGHPAIVKYMKFYRQKPLIRRHMRLHSVDIRYLWRTNRKKTDHTAPTRF